jgi:hypothetical protein
MGHRVSRLIEIATAMKTQLDAVFTGLDVQVSATRTFDPSPPAIDIYPPDDTEPEPEAALGFGQIVGEETIVWTVRARVNTADYEGGQLLLLEFADPASSYCVASALEDEQTLNGYVSSVNVGSPSGHRFYSDVGEGPHLGIQWRVETINAVS